VTTWSDVEYEADGLTMVGRLALPTGGDQVPAVLIAHGAPGLDDYCRSRPEVLADLGYAALAMDYHGGGRPLADASALAARLDAIGSDADRLRSLALAGLNELLSHERVDPTRVAAVGYCFGAVVVMELARTGADVKAIVGFHPGLTSSRPEDSRNIVGRVLMCVGADDPLVPIDERARFQDEMRAAGVDWQMHLYGGAKHRFTDPNAAAAGVPGLEYNQPAAERSWRAMLDLFEETLV
jgi:dienelactone hydrolase